MNRMRGVIGTAGAIALSVSCWSQPTQPATSPAEGPPLQAKVIEVRGEAEYSPLDQSQWQSCRVSDEYPQETIIRSGIRSSVKLQIGIEPPYTAVVVDPATKVILSELIATAQTKRVRLGLSYGRIRAGVAEGGLKSEFTVDCPVATLSKRGTWNFGMFYERGTDRFEVFLLERGLVEAINEITGQRRELLPGQAVTEAMRRWADEAQIRRNVPIPDVLGQGDIEIAFNRLRQDGLGVLDPAGGRAMLIDLSNDQAAQAFALLARGRLGLPFAPSAAGGLPSRPEGYFGTGRGDQLIPVIIEANSELAEKGFARPGTYVFRRAALENWLENYGGR